MLRVLGVARPVAAGRRRWVSAVITWLLLSGGFVNSGFAQVTNLSLGQSINLSQLTSGLSLQVGDKLFSDFAFGSVSNNFQPSMVAVSALSNQIGFGISFQLNNFLAVGNATNDIALKFSVKVLDPDNLISDAHLTFTGDAWGAAFADIAETVYTNGFGGDSIASLSVTTSGNPADQSASSIFAVPQTKIWVQKDVSVVAFGSEAGDHAGISIIDQTFSEVPEPSTLVLLVAGLIALLLVTRRTRRAPSIDLRRPGRR